MPTAAGASCCRRDASGGRSSRSVPASARADPPRSVLLGGPLVLDRRRDGGRDRGREEGIHRPSDLVVGIERSAGGRDPATHLHRIGLRVIRLDIVPGDLLRNDGSQRQGDRAIIGRGRCVAAGRGRGLPLIWFLPSDFAWYIARSAATISSSAESPSSGCETRPMLTLTCDSAPSVSSSSSAPTRIFSATTNA